MNPSISAAPEPFQVGKRYRTRGGWAAEVKLDDGSNIPLRVVHEVIHATHSEETVWHLRDGRLYHTECDYDLLPPAPKRISRTVWVNVYENGLDCTFGAREDAVTYAKSVGLKQTLRIAVPCRLEEIGE